MVAIFGVSNNSTTLIAFLCKEVFFSVNHAGTVSDEWAVMKVSVNW